MIVGEAQRRARRLRTKTPDIPHGFTGLIAQARWEGKADFENLVDGEY